jgi:hypothetical protein
MALHAKMVSGELNTMMNYAVCIKIQIVRVIKVTRIRWLGIVVRMEENSRCQNDNLVPA